MVAKKEEMLGRGGGGWCSLAPYRIPVVPCGAETGSLVISKSPMYVSPERSGGGRQRDHVLSKGWQCAGADR